jgi:hypothetical protein
MFASYDNYILGFYIYIIFIHEDFDIMQCIIYAFDLSVSVHYASTIMTRLSVFQLPAGRRDIEQCGRNVGIERRRRRLRDDPKRFIFVHIS